MVKKNQKLNIYGFMMLVIGFFACTNVIYAFVVGSTPIYVEQLLAVIFLCYTIVLQKGKLFNIRGVINKELLLLFIFIIASIIPVAIFNRDNIYQWVVGVVALILNIFIILLVLELKDYLKYLYIGIIIGIIANFIISAYAMLMYHRGIIYSLTELFPATHMATHYLSNAFRARGFFREQGHLMRFLAVFFFPVSAYVHKYGSKLAEIFVILAMLFLMAFSGSSSLAFFGVGLVLYFALLYRENAAKIIGWSVLGTIVVVLLVLFGNQLPLVGNAINTFVIGVTSILDFSGSNSARMQGMRYAIEIIKDYPITGCGWNNLTKLFMSYGFYGTNAVLGSYSAALSLVAEIGLASLFYFYFIVNKVAICLKNCTDQYVLSIGVSMLVYGMIFMSTDFTIDCSSAVFIAIATIAVHDIKTRNDVQEICEDNN